MSQEWVNWQKFNLWLNYTFKLSRTTKQSPPVKAPLKFADRMIQRFKVNFILFFFSTFGFIFSHVESVAQCPEMLRNGRCLLLMLPRLVNSRRNVNTFVKSTLTKPLVTDSFLLAGKNCFIKPVYRRFFENIFQRVILFSSKTPKHWKNYRLHASKKCNICKPFQTSCSVLYISHMRGNIFSRSYCTYTLN